MKKNNKPILYITVSALIAALYFVLTYLSFGFASGAVQCRISEMLCVTAAYTSAAIPGLTVGCLIANLLLSGSIWDIIFGTFATFLGAIFTYILRKYKYLASVPPILSNTVIVSLTLTKLMNVGESLPMVMLGVFVGEVISCGVLGTLAVVWLEKTKNGKYLKNILQNKDF